MNTGPTYSETELLRQVADGNENAFNEFFKRYFNQLYLIMFRYTNRHNEAEDIVQTVFIKAWEKRAIFKEIDNPLNWFFISARNEYLDRFRKAARSKEYQTYLTEWFSESESVGDASTSPEAIFTNKEYAVIYYEAINNLPEKQKQAYTLSREKGLTYEEIAAAMKVEKSTVKEHISRAIRSIRTFVIARTGAEGEFIFILFFLKLLSPSIISDSSLL